MHKQVGIVSRLANKSENSPGFGLHHNHCTGEIAQRLFSRVLQFHIQVQNQVIPRQRRDFIDHPEDSTLRIHLDILLPDNAMKLFLVILLQPGLANMRGATVVTHINGIELLLTDASDITYRMRR